MPNEVGIGPNWWWMSTSSGRFATGITMSITTDPATNQSNWFITALARNVYFLSSDCTGQSYTADSTFSVDQDLLLLHKDSPGLTYDASLVVDIYTPDFGVAPANRSFSSFRQASNGNCVSTTTGSLKSRPAPLVSSSVALTNAFELRY
jgi:hypothetical protein